MRRWAPDERMHLSSLSLPFTHEMHSTVSWCSRWPSTDAVFWSSKTVSQINFCSLGISLPVAFCTAAPLEKDPCIQPKLHAFASSSDQRRSCSWRTLLWKVWLNIALWCGNSHLFCGAGLCRRLILFCCWCIHGKNADFLPWWPQFGFIEIFVPLLYSYFVEACILRNNQQYRLLIVSHAPGKVWERHWSCHVYNFRISSVLWTKQLAEMGKGSYLSQIT